MPQTTNTIQTIQFHTQLFGKKQFQLPKKSTLTLINELCLSAFSNVAFISEK